jgi:predicted kinase
MVNLLLVRGLPGSGKTTFAKKWAAENNATHCEADFYVETGTNGEYLYKKELAGYYHASCLSEAFNHLLCGRSCVVSNTFTQYWEIAPYIDIANRAKAKLSIHICRDQYNNIHNVPDEIMQLMKDRWEE